MLKIRRSASRPHPCDPWTSLVPAVGDSLFPGGRDASSPVLERRLQLLEHWKERAGWNATEAAALALRVHRTQGVAAALEMERILAGAPVVLTGQQPVLGGGPFFVWLKAWTAIVQARSLSHRLGLPVRAVFWVAGDDSDLPEVRHLGDPVLGTTWDGLPGVDDIGRPVGSLVLPDAPGLAADLRRAWPGSALPDLLRSGTTLSEATLLCLRHWFGDEIVVVDADWPQLRALARGTYSRFAGLTESVHDAVDAGLRASRAAGLRADLGTARDRVRLFRRGPDGIRRRISVASGSASDGSGWKVAAAELAHAVESAPADFSHDAGSRPFAAEEALPVLAHVLGPGEFAYFSCLAEVGRILSRPLAPALPRASATLLPAGPWRDALLAGWDPRRNAMTWSEVESTFLRALSPEWSVWGRRWRDARRDYLDGLDLPPDDPHREVLDRKLAAGERSLLGRRLRERAAPHADRIRRLRDLWNLSGAGLAQERLLPAWALEHHLGGPELLPTLSHALDPDDPLHGVWEVG